MNSEYQTPHPDPHTRINQIHFNYMMITHGIEVCPHNTLPPALKVKVTTLTQNGSASVLAHSNTASDQLLSIPCQEKLPVTTDRFSDRLQWFARTFVILKTIQPQRLTWRIDQD